MTLLCDDDEYCNGNGVCAIRENYFVCECSEGGYILPQPWNWSRIIFWCSLIHMVYLDGLYRIHIWHSWSMRVGGGWGVSKVVATFNHVGRSFNLFMATPGDVWIIPSFRIWDYVLHVEHVLCVITNCDQHQCVIPSPLSIGLQALLEENTTRKLLSLSLDLFFKIMLFQVAFLIFFSIAVFSP